MTITVEPIKATINDASYFIELGIVHDTWLGREDHGIFTYNLEFNFNGSVQGFGNYCLGDPEQFGKHVQALLDFTGGRWEDLRGRSFYVVRETQFGPILGLVSNDQSRSFFIKEVTNG